MVGEACYSEMDAKQTIRIDIVLALIKDYGLYVASTFTDRQLFTRIAWKLKHGRLQHYQIDFICASNALRDSCVMVCNKDRMWKSDHYPLSMQISLHHKSKCAAPRTSMAGWKMTEPENVHAFRGRFIEHLEATRQ